MLVLSRRLNQQVFLGEDHGVVVTVVEIRGDKVRLGFEAPAETAIIRDDALVTTKRGAEAES